MACLVQPAFQKHELLNQTQKEGCSLVWLRLQRELKGKEKEQPKDLGSGRGLRIPDFGLNSLVVAAPWPEVRTVLPWTWVSISWARVPYGCQCPSAGLSGAALARPGQFHGDRNHWSHSKHPSKIKCACLSAATWHEGEILPNPSRSL